MRKIAVEFGAGTGAVQRTANEIRCPKLFREYRDAVTVLKRLER
jgi:hypothetical protein